MLYLVAGMYGEMDVDLTGREIECDDGPFMALVAHCMQCCKIEQHAACKYLQDSSFDVCMWRVDEGGLHRLTYQDIGYPWCITRELRDEIKRINDALDRVADLQFLLALPNQDGSNTIDLQPAREYLAAKEAELVAVQEKWDKMQLSPPEDNRESRVVQVDSPDG